MGRTAPCAGGEESRVRRSMSNKTLRDLRDQTVKSREEVARELHTTGRIVDAYENGTRRLGIKQVFILAKFYNCTVGEVIRAESNSYRRKNE